MPCICPHTEKKTPHSFHKRPTFCVPFCPLLRSAEIKSSFPHLICCAGFRNCAWEVNGPDWWQIPLISSVPSSSCLIAVNQFIRWLIFSLWLCCRFGGVGEQPASAGPLPGNAASPLNTQHASENFDVAVWKLSPAWMIDTVEAVSGQQERDARWLKGKRELPRTHLHSFFFPAI